MSVPWSLLNDSFHRGMELTAGARRAWLGRIGIGRPELVAELEELFRVTEHSGESLEEEFAADWRDARPGWTGRQLGHFRVLRRLGRGGMGCVHLAVRTDRCFDRWSAVKHPSSCFPRRQTARAVRSEYRILSTLDHPNVVRSRESGQTPEGVPYFIMDFVDGESIDRFCDRRRLSMAERLRLLLQVCEAVGHVHSHSVVHRDLKPGNVWVSKTGRVSLLDFGISHVLRPGLGAGPDRRQVRALTPIYASPEELSGKRLTLAADLFSLGLLLSKVLVGVLPAESGAGGGIARLGQGCSDERQPVSAALAAQSTQTQSDLARNRRVEVEDLLARSRQDLDPIVSRCLRIDPARRYGDVRELEAALRSVAAAPRTVTASTKGFFHER